MKKIVAALLFCSSTFTYGAIELNCRSYGKMDGWNGGGTFDYINFKANVISNSELANAKVTGAYTSDTRSLKADDKYKSEKSKYKNFNRFKTLEDAWYWFDPLLPKDMLSKETPFTAYLWIFSEVAFYGTVEFKCFLSDRDNQAEIKALDRENTEYSVALNPLGEVKIDNVEESYPSIKDFGNNGEYIGFCYQGSVSGTQKLLTALVAAADGDGDSWVKDYKIDQNLVTGEFTVEVVLEDESSASKVVSYSISACQ